MKEKVKEKKVERKEYDLNERERDRRKKKKSIEKGIILKRERKGKIEGKKKEV